MKYVCSTEPKLGPAPPIKMSKRIWEGLTLAISGHEYLAYTEKESLCILGICYMLIMVIVM
jgi:hypothetical protein